MINTYTYAYPQQRVKRVTKTTTRTFNEHEVLVEEYVSEETEYEYVPASIPSHPNYWYTNVSDQPVNPGGFIGDAANSDVIGK